MFVLAVVCLLIGSSRFPPSATTCIIIPFGLAAGINRGKAGLFGILQWPLLVFCGEIKGPICGGGDEGVTGGQGEEERGIP